MPRPHQFVGVKGDLATDLYNIQQQLVQLQELTGQSQQRLSELRTQLEAIPHVQSVQFVSKDQALTILGQRFKRENREDITAQLPGNRNPLPASFNVKPDDLANLGTVRAALTPPGGRPSGSNISSA